MDRVRKQSKIIQEYGFTKMGHRHLQILLLFLCGFMAYLMRAAMSVGIVAMISEDPPDGIPTYPEWKDKQGTLLSSFFWGYILLQVFAGQIAEKYGPKYFLVGAFTIASFFNCLIPFMAAEFGSTGVIVNRAIQGLCQGFLYPSSHYVLSKWTPLKERSRIAGFVYFAAELGTGVSMIVTGALSSSKFGWPCVFYLYGAFGFAWVAFYMWLGSNSPAEHKSISFEERKYIEHTTEVIQVDEVRLKTPWKEILGSPAFLAILISHIGNNWGFWILLTEIPTYMSNVLGYEIKEDGNLSALPYFIFCIFGVIISPLSDELISRNILSLGNSRKLFNSIGLLCPALFLIILCLVPRENSTLHVVLLVLAVSTNAGILAGYNLNHIDISPNFSGTLMGITNSLANIGSIIGPLSVDFIVTDLKDESLWKIVFYITAGLYIFAAVIFVIFGSGEIQSWNFPKNESKKHNSADFQHNVATASPI